MPRNQSPQTDSAETASTGDKSDSDFKQELSVANEDVASDTDSSSNGKDIVKSKETTGTREPAPTGEDSVSPIKDSIQEQSEVEDKSLHPFVHWAQSQTHISLRVDLIQAQKLKVFIGEDSVNLEFSAQGTGAHGLQNYFFSLTFHSEVDRRFECHTIERYVLIFIKKLHSGSSWPRLTQQAIKLPWLRVDFDRYTDEDSDDNISGEDSDNDLEDDEEKLNFNDSNSKGTLYEGQHQDLSDYNLNANETINFQPGARGDVSDVKAKNLDKVFAQNSRNNNPDIFNPFKRKIVKTNRSSSSNMKFDHRKDTMNTMESSKNTAKHALDFRKTYLFLYNLVMFVMFLKVFIVLLVKSISGPVDDDVVRGAAFIVKLLTYTQLLESIHPMLGLVPGGFFMPFLQSIGRLVVNELLVNDEIRQGTHPYVHYLFIVWSSIEIVRYSYYALNVYKVKIYPLTWLRYTLFLPLYPCGGFCESQVIFSTIRYFEKTGQYSISLPNSANISFSITMALRIYVFILLGPSIVTLMRYMLKQRSKQLVKEKVA